MAEQKSSSALTAPLRGAASALRRVPGAGPVGRAAEETLDRIGAVSPRGRRIAVYAGAGVLGVTGVVEWPVALTGAAVAWLTQPRPVDHPGTEQPGTGSVGAESVGTDARAGRTPSETAGTAARTPTAVDGPAERTPAGKAAIRQAVMDKAVTEGAVEEEAVARAQAERTEVPHDIGSAALRSGPGTAPAATTDTAHTDATSPTSHHKPEGAHGDAPPPSPKPSTGPLGPTARPGRTVL
ncbi:hypothetical protein [Streptomyces sp. NPDC047028]|uniref:hypothetical protein n=1 Tax=Streptomyces sp. NPDC047028 TaxID=3155793 RepID=UPI0033F866D0